MYGLWSDNSEENKMMKTLIIIFLLGALLSCQKGPIARPIAIAITKPNNIGGRIIMGCDCGFGSAAASLLIITRDTSYIQSEDDEVLSDSSITIGRIVDTTCVDQ